MATKMLKPKPGISKEPRTKAENAKRNAYIEKYGEAPDPQTNADWEYIEVNVDKKMGGGVGKTEFQAVPKRQEKPKKAPKK